MGAFVYPFNFVPLPRDETEQLIKPACLPPESHKLPNGLNGSLELSLHILTPLAIPHTFEGRIEPDGHRHCSFFRANSQLVIPGTSLKGMLRSVVEALTNSCLSQVSESRVRFRKRITQLSHSRRNERLTRSDQSDYIHTYKHNDMLRIDEGRSVKAGMIVPQNEQR